MGKPRNPEYFPSMKVRGGNRRKKAPWQRLARTMRHMGQGAERVAEAFQRIMVQVERHEVEK